MKPLHTPRPLDYALASLIAFGTIAVLFVTQDMGFTRDESFYFHAAEQYAGWFRELIANSKAGIIGESFTQANIDRHWSYNPEHPVLVKTSFALSGLLFHETLGWMSPSEAFRFPAFLFTGWLLVVVYLFTYRAWGSRAAAVLAPLLLMTLPRFFFHTHLTCFDVPVTTVWVAFIYAYWRSLDTTRWAWLAGAMWGVALITKLNAFFLPFVVLAHWGIGAARHIRVDRSLRITVPRVPLAWVAMATLGPLIFYVGWPRHWFDTLNRVLWYMRFHLHHEHYFVTFFGEALIRPPFPVEFPFVMTLVTTPIVHLLAFAVGAALLVWRWIAQRRAGEVDPRGTSLLIAMNILIPFLIIARPSTPVFGGVKHWFPALPFMCMVAAYGIVRVAASFDGRQRAAALALMAACALGVGARDTAHIHPYGTSYYSPIIGGITGAADRKATRQIWGYASRGALDWVNRNVPASARVHFHDSAWGAYAMYQREGLLRDDVRGVWSIEGSDYFLLDHDKAFEPEHYRMWHDYGTQSPVHTVTINGVPVISVYQRLEDAD